MLHKLLVITFMVKLAQSDHNVMIETETQELNSPIISNETITPILSYKSNKVTFYEIFLESVWYIRYKF